MKEPQPYPGIPELKFSHNWNGKLSNRAFTTFRLYNPERYYLNATFNIYLKGEFLKVAKVIDYKRLKLTEVSEFIARLDTGLNVADFGKVVTTMYKKSNLNYEKQLFQLILFDTLNL